MDDFLNPYWADSSAQPVLPYYLTITLSNAYAGLSIVATPTSGTAVTGTTDANGKVILGVEPNTVYSVTGTDTTNYYFSTETATTTTSSTSVTLTCYRYPVITVAVTDLSSQGYQSGRTITATNSGTIYSGNTDALGITAIKVLSNTGTWTLACINTPSGLTETWSAQSVTVSAGGSYSITMSLSEQSSGYGYAAVDIAIGTSDPSSRCTYPQTITVNGSTVDNSCYGYTPMAGSSGGTFSTGSWTSHGILDGIKPVSSDGGSTPTFTDADKDASTWTSGTEYFTEFPFNWLSITNDGSKIRIIFSDSDTQPDSTFQCYAHAKACDSYSNSDIESSVSSASRSSIMSSNNNSYFANAFHIGCFGGNITSSNLYSKCSNTYTRSTAYAYYWQYANARGGEYDCMSFQQWTYLQALFILLFKSTNSQGAHSHGLAKVGSETLSGIDTNAPLTTDNLGMAGKIGVAERMAFFWIHDLWGNYYQFIGGIWNRAQSGVYKLYYWLPRQANSRAFNNGWSAASSYATQANMGTDTGLTYSSSGNFIVGTAGTNTGGFAPTNTSGGSATTYWCDRGIVSAASSSAYFPRVGGRYSYSSGDVGLFSCVVNSYSTYSDANNGSRLSYRGGR